jgi:hypothetical protein
MIGHSTTSATNNSPFCVFELLLSMTAFNSDSFKGTGIGKGGGEGGVTARGTAEAQVAATDAARQRNDPILHSSFPEYKVESRMLITRIFCRVHLSTVTSSNAFRKHSLMAQKDCGPAGSLYSLLYVWHPLIHQSCHR